MELIDIKSLRKDLGMSAQEFANEAGVHLRTVQNWEAGAKVSTKNLSVIEGLVRKAEMQHKEVDTHSLIPLIPMRARGGSLSDYSDNATLEECEQIVNPVHGAQCAIKIAGNSMEPEFPDGSTVYLRRILEPSFIEWGSTYVLDTASGAVIKQIYAEDGAVSCHSINPKYQPFSVKLPDILGWYKVLGVLTLK